MESTGMWVACACTCTHACMMGGSRESAVGEYCGKSVRASRNISASDPSPSPATSLTTHAARARVSSEGWGEGWGGLAARAGVG
jgi:hypothetical protein